MTIAIFRANPSASTFVDNSAWNIADADIPSYMYGLAMNQWISGGTSAASFSSSGGATFRVPFHIDSGTTLYAAIYSTSGTTLNAGTVVYVSLHIEQN